MIDRCRVDVTFACADRERMAMNPIDNLRGFVSSRPPLVIFMLCLGLFTIVLLTVANYVQVTKLRNPDVSEVCFVHFCSPVFNRMFENIRFLYQLSF